MLRRVQLYEGYPRTHQPLDAFIAYSPDMPLAWVAEQQQQHESASPEPKSRIIGHVALGRATDSDLAVRTWRAQQPGDSSTPASDGTLRGGGGGDVSLEQTFPDGIAVLERLFVDPEARRVGAAAALIAAAVEEAHRRRLRLVLFVLEANDAARRLYERLGWVVYGHGTFHYPGSNEGEHLQMSATCFASPLPSTAEH